MAPLDMTDKTFPTWPDVAAQLVEVAAGRRAADTIITGGIWVNVHTRECLPDHDIAIAAGRIAFVGPNGAGKTTLLKMLTGEVEPDSGSIRRGTNLELAVFDQTRAQLDPDASLWENLTGDPLMRISGQADQVMVRGTPRHVVGYLKEFLFDPGLVDAKVGTLSGGEQSRLLLAREFARISNLLVLDEPTNDLDLETLDLLQEGIADYEGTVLIVSHDRDFLDRTVTLTLGLDGSGDVDVVAGGYADWEKKRKVRTDNTARSKKKSAPPPPPPPPPPPGKLSYKDQRDYELLPDRIAELEKAIARGEKILSDPDLFSSDPARFERVSKGIGTARAEKEAAEERWLDLAERVEG